MRIKAEMAFDLLEAELEVLDRNAQSEILGGEYEWWIVNDQVYYREGGADVWTCWQSLNDAIIYASGNGSGYGSGNGSGGYGSSGDGFNSQFSSCGYPDAPGASGSFYTWYDTHYRGGGVDYQANHLTEAQDAASLAVSHGLAWKEFYSTLANLSTDTRVDAKTILNAVFDSNPFKTIVNDLSLQNLRGVGIINAAGKVLGVTSAFSSGLALIADLTDGDDHVSPVVVADAVISIGALAIKSNIVGFAISGGWLLIKGEFEE